ncbi:MAG: hypothetical protein R3B91_10270 [Planctomycetaceae bacterium]
MRWLKRSRVRLRRSHLIAEAGTGVGKSFAYLVPVMLALARQDPGEKGRKRIVVNTHTISLQEQLIPETCRSSTQSCRSVLGCAGRRRSNCISLRRLRGQPSGHRHCFPNGTRSSNSAASVNGRETQLTGV